MVRFVCAAMTAALCAAACGGGGGGGKDYDAGTVDHRDAGLIDAAPPDAAPPVDWPLELQTPAGAGHVEGDGISMDMQIGDFVDQHKMTGGGFTLEGATVVKSQGAP